VIVDARGRSGALKRSALLGAATLVATLLTGVTASAASADPAARQPTAPPLTAVAVDAPTLAPAAVARRQKVTASGSLPASVRRPVTLQRKSGRRWLTIAVGKTTPSGHYRLRFRAPTKLGDHALRVSARSGAFKTGSGREHYPALHSRSAHLRVYAHAPGSRAAERAALLDLYQHTASRHHFWAHQRRWGSHADICTWAGVTCTAGHVTGLNLKGDSGEGIDGRGIGWLTGRVPFSIGSLTHLRSLTLPGATFTGKIPASMQDLVRLRTLVLGGRLIGAIPAWIGNLTDLRELHLSGDFTGPIPASIGDLANLETLDLRGTGRTDMSGGIPAELGKLTHLSYLDLDLDGLTGTIPASITDLTQLTYVDLNFNQLSGALPASLGDLVHLRQLNLAGNRLSGAIPGSIGSLTGLDVLDLSSNQLSGPIPVSLDELDPSFLNMSNNRGCLTADDPTLLGWLSAHSYVPHNGCIVTLGESQS
jgi:hypothetical protein